MMKEFEEVMAQLSAMKVGKLILQDKFKAELIKCEPKLVRNLASFGDRLKAFREDIGEEEYLLMVDTSTFMPLFEKWGKDAPIRNTNLIKHAIKMSLPDDHDCSEEDITCFVPEIITCAVEQQ